MIEEQKPDAVIVTSIDRTLRPPVVLFDPLCFCCPASKS